ncbi:SURF1 family cytochrome oxidase biogenesis protein [Brachybacterium sp. GPGPB12]|uniref:SURF1 family cytochrome oxidase biogenesis protein n=1 Tax=Brachybacterium sp. GPGPB12 TaxID=3023517 RepID=UPI003134308A
MTDRSARRRILLSRDTLLGLVVVLLLAAVCVSLGLWQYGRFEDKRDRAAVIEENYDASAVPLAEAMPDPARSAPGRAGVDAGRDAGQLLHRSRPRALRPQPPARRRGRLLAAWSPSAARTAPR